MSVVVLNIKNEVKGKFLKAMKMGTLNNNMRILRAIMKGI